MSYLSELYDSPKVQALIDVWKRRAGSDEISIRAAMSKAGRGDGSKPFSFEAAYEVVARMERQGVADLWDNKNIDLGLYRQKYADVLGSSVPTLSPPEEV